MHDELRHGSPLLSSGRAIRICVCTDHMHTGNLAQIQIMELRGLPAIMMVLH